MQILCMVDCRPDINSGAAGTEIQTRNILEHLGVEVDILWDKDISHFIRHGNIHYLLELPLSLRERMEHMLTYKHYDIIQITQPHGYAAAKLIREKYRDIVFVHRSHGFELRASRDLEKWEKIFPFDNRFFLKKILSRILGKWLDKSSHKIARYADGHIVSATQCKNFLVRELGVPAGYIAVMPQGSPDSYFDYQPGSLGSERFKKILYVGQFAFFKAPMILAKVFSALAEKRKDLCFTWVCSQQHHAQARALLDSGIRDRVEFIDWLPQEKLRDVYDQHGIFLFPSFFEGFGKTFLEAMARGLCVVAADNGGMHDVIEHGVTGKLVSTGDCAAMVSACLDLVEHPDQSVGMSQKAMESAKLYTWQRVGQETLEFYEKLITKKLAR